MSYWVQEQPYVDNLRGQVLDDTPCRKCACNLRGQPLDGRCPQCGLLVAVSLVGDLLRFSHPRWLGQVSQGLMNVLWGLLISIVVGTAAGILMKNEPAVRQIFITLGSLVGVIGTLQMTAPEPGGLGEAPGLGSRQIVRVAVIAGVISNVVQIFAGKGVPTVAAGLVSALCGLLAIVGEFAKLHYIGLLAGRIPDDALRDRANFLKWALAMCYGAIVILGLIVVLSVASAVAGMAASGGTAGAPSAGMALGGVMMLSCMMLPVGIALIVFAIMGLILIYNVSKAIRAQVPLAVDLWTRAAQHGKQGAAVAIPVASPVPAPASPASGPQDSQRPWF